MKYNTILTMMLNDLARMIYAARGYEVKSGYDFSKATYPQEREAWDIAVMSYHYWTKD